jgi:hypothetical protein
VPITTIDCIVFKSGNTWRSFFNKPTESPTASQVRCSADPFAAFALPGSTYGCLNRPGSNFMRSVRATAASMIFKARRVLRMRNTKRSYRHDPNR